jgi:hypothetical protein
MSTASRVSFSRSLYDPAFHRHGPDCHGIVSGTVQGARGVGMCIRPPRRRYLCLRPEGDSRRRSRFLKKRPDRHWLAEGRLELRSQPIELRTLVRSWLCSPTSTGALYVRAWTVSPTIQRHNDMHREHTLLRCARFQACNPAREILVSLVRRSAMCVCLAGWRRPPGLCG